jgi:hypothetical protein
MLRDPGGGYFRASNDFEFRQNLYKFVHSNRDFTAARPGCR